MKHESIQRDYHKKYLELIANTLINQFKPKRVLDVGCGVGDLVSNFKKSGIESYGIDINESAIKSCVYDVKDNLYVANGEKLPFKENTFDLIISHHVLEHLENPENFINESKRVLKKGGIVAIVLTVSPLELTKIWRILGLQKDPSHISLYARAFWIESFRTHGFNYIDNFDDILKKDPPTIPLGKFLIRLGPIGRKIWLNTLIYIRASFIFKLEDKEH